MIEQNLEFQNENNPEYISPKKLRVKISLIPIFGLVIILTLGLLLFKSVKKNPELVVEEPEPEASGQPIPTTLAIIPPTTSFLATDAAVLRTKKNIEDNIQAVNTIDLSEPNINFPILDFEIGF